MLILTLSMLNMSVLFMMMNHPLSMGLILLIQTILISMITGLMSINFWFSYILFLIMIGGMLILFIYMTSIASNEKFKMNYKMIMMLLIIPLSLPLMNFNQSTMMNNEMTVLNNNLNINQSFTKYTDMPMSMILVFMMIYLLMTLIATVKITNFKQGSIRQMN